MLGQGAVLFRLICVTLNFNSLDFNLRVKFN